jgi:hypothetical protein
VAHVVVQHCRLVVHRGRTEVHGAVAAAEVRLLALDARPLAFDVRQFAFLVAPAGYVAHDERRRLRTAVPSTVTVERPTDRAGNGWEMATG